MTTLSRCGSYKKKDDNTTVLSQQRLNEVVTQASRLILRCYPKLKNHDNYGYYSNFNRQHQEYKKKDRHEWVPHFSMLQKGLTAAEYLGDAYLAVDLLALGCKVDQ